MAESVTPITQRTVRAVAVAFLCTVAATVALWSGPLLSASSAMHSSPPAAVHAVSAQLNR
jgi:hypothetical protein